MRKASAAPNAVGKDEGDATDVAVAKPDLDTTLAPSATAETATIFEIGNQSADIGAGLGTTSPLTGTGGNSVANAAAVDGAGRHADGVQISASDGAATVQQSELEERKHAPASAVTAAAEAAEANVIAGSRRDPVACRSVCSVGAPADSVAVGNAPHAISAASADGAGDDDGPLNVAANGETTVLPSLQISAGGAAVPSSTRHFAVGQQVQYWSATLASANGLGGWCDAIVEGVRLGRSGDAVAYDLSRKKNAPAQRVRAMPSGDKTSAHSASARKGDASDAIGNKADNAGEVKEAMQQATVVKPKALEGNGVASVLRFAVGEDVLYWSETKGKWVQTTVEAKRDLEGTSVYDLSCKRGVPLGRLRPQFKEGENVEYFSDQTGRWMPARVIRIINSRGMCDLNIKNHASWERIRRTPTSAVAMPAATVVSVAQVVTSNKSQLVALPSGGAVTKPVRPKSAPPKVAAPSTAAPPASKPEERNATSTHDEVQVECKRCGNTGVDVRGDPCTCEFGAAAASAAAAAVAAEVAAAAAAARRMAKVDGAAATAEEEEVRATAKPKRRAKSAPHLLNGQDETALEERQSVGALDMAAKEAEKAKATKKKGKKKRRDAAEHIAGKSVGEARSSLDEPRMALQESYDSFHEVSKDPLPPLQRRPQAAPEPGAPATVVLPMRRAPVPVAAVVAAARARSQTRSKSRTRSRSRPRRRNQGSSVRPREGDKEERVRDRRRDRDRAGGQQRGASLSRSRGGRDAGGEWRGTGKSAWRGGRGLNAWEE